MKYIKCKILDGNNVIAENIDVLINESPPSSISKSWQGGFELPFNSVKLGGKYELILEDGRSGDIIITRININLVKFIGTGPLK
jgi:hypothetical protein